MGVEDDIFGYEPAGAARVAAHAGVLEPVRGPLSGRHRPGGGRALPHKETKHELTETTHCNHTLEKTTLRLCCFSQAGHSPEEVAAQVEAMKLAAEGVDAGSLVVGHNRPLPFTRVVSPVNACVGKLSACM